MLLLRPSPGECVDRQTILVLKIRAAAIKGIDGKHFAEEHQALQMYLEQNWQHDGSDGWLALFGRYAAELAKVNQSLWDLEDEVRFLKSLPEQERRSRIERIAAIGLAVPEMNDLRARLVAKINALFGIVDREKLYVDVAVQPE